MKTRPLGTPAWLLIFGAAAILLIGAFARFDSSRDGNSSLARSTAALPLAPIEAGGATEVAGSPALPANLSPGLDQVIKLAQSHLGDEVILAFIQNSRRTYNPTADEILYLTDLGVSQTVISALYARTTPSPTSLSPGTNTQTPLESEPAPSYPDSSARTVAAAAPPSLPPVAARDDIISPPPPALAEPPPQDDVAASYFYDQLSPYGSWVDLGDQGWFWQPTVVTTVAGWLPYRDRGRWRYTDSGWYWQSDYSWGWAAFHYGRWLNSPRFGWVWNPGQTWAPAWVAWRNSETYAGWAALPPGAPINFAFGPAVNPADLDAGFGLSASAFTFVPYADFTAPGQAASYAAPAGVVAAIFRGSKPVNNYVRSGNNLINLGVTPAQIGAATHRPVKKYVLKEVPSSDSANKTMNGGALAVYRPAISGRTARPNLIADSRQARAEAAEETAVPARDIATSGDDGAAPRAEDQATVETPRTAPPEPSAWTARRVSGNPGAGHADFRGGRFANHQAAMNGSQPPPRLGERGPGFPPPDSPQPIRGDEGSPNRSTAVDDAASRGRFYNGEPRANPERPASPEPRASAPPPVTSKK